MDERRGEETEQCTSQLYTHTHTHKLVLSRRESPAVEETLSTGPTASHTLTKIIYRYLHTHTPTDSLRSPSNSR